MKDYDILVASGIFVLFGILIYIASKNIIPSLFLVVIGITLALYQIKDKILVKNKNTTNKKITSKEGYSIEDKVLDIVKNNPGILQTELISKLELSRSDAYKILERLEQENKIERVKEGRTYKIFPK